MTLKKSQYLEIQENLAAYFINLGGPSKGLGEERIKEARRAVELSDADFEEYVQDWVQD